MQTFDYPEMGPNCVLRSTSTVSPQSLMLMNDAHVRSLARNFSDRIRYQPPRDGDWSMTVRKAYATAFSRQPTREELSIGQQALQTFEAEYDDRDRALETYCHSLLNSAAFLYVD